MSVAKGGGGQNADNGWQTGAGVLATDDITDKMTKKYNLY